MAKCAKCGQGFMSFRDIAGVAPNVMHVQCWRDSVEERIRIVEEAVQEMKREQLLEVSELKAEVMALGGYPWQKFKYNPTAEVKG